MSAAIGNSGESLTSIHDSRTFHLLSLAWLALHWDCIVGNLFARGSVGSSRGMLVEIDIPRAESDCGDIGV